MAITPILPITGVPDELIRVLNVRFRELSSAAASTANGSVYGLFFTHKTRPDANAQAVGTYGTDIDRGVVYQVQTVKAAQTWVYASGVMSDTIANQPSDLGTDDIGFLFFATDTYQQFRWDGSAWVEVTQANLVQIAYASAGLALTTSFQDITGATITLTRKGRHLILASFDFTYTAGDVGNALIGQLVADGSAQTQQAIVQSSGNANFMAAQHWIYTPSATGKVVKLQAKKNGTGGTSSANNPGTSISALWIGP
jgi:hypothetical protein